MPSAQIEKLLNVARGELGTKESPLGSNKVKYNTWYYGRVVSGSAYPWCSVFVTWVFYHAGMFELAWGTLAEARRIYAEGARNWKVLAQSKGRWVTGNYQPGDVIIFDYERDGVIDHVGIVESVNGSTINTIEGNTSDSVARKQRTASVLVGAYRPDYDSLSVSTAVGTITETIAPAPDGTIKVGSVVKIKPGSMNYTQTKRIAPFACDRESDVLEITKGDRVVVTYGGVIVAAVRMSDLELVR